MSKSLHIDEWVWGKETIIWGFDSSHQYTFKVLEPKKGKEGMLSLQYHHQKSESWYQLRGSAWALLVIDSVICTRILTPGDIQNIPTGTIHRLMALTDDCQVLEPSTPDKHAADKSLPKDVVRLDCILGRPISEPRDQLEAKIVIDSKIISLKACEDIDNNKMPEELNTDLLIGKTGFKLS